MRDPTGIPPREDGRESDQPCSIRRLAATKEMNGGRTSVLRIIPVLIAMPDVDKRAFDRRTTVVLVLDRYLNVHRYAPPVGTDVGHRKRGRIFCGEWPRCFRRRRGARAVVVIICRID